MVEGLETRASKTAFDPCFQFELAPLHGGEAKAAYRKVARELALERGDKIPASSIKESTPVSGPPRFVSKIYLRGVVPPKTVALGTFDTRGRAMQVDPMKPTFKAPGANEALETKILLIAFRRCFQLQLAPLHREEAEAAYRRAAAGDFSAGADTRPLFSSALAFLVGCTRPFFACREHFTWGKLGGFMGKHVSG